LASAREAFTTMLWPMPTLIIAATVAAGVLLPELDRAIDKQIPSGIALLLFGGGASEARQLLTAIATGLITTVSLVFSLTVVVFQLASSQYSPRLLRVFPRDPLIRTTLGVLVGSFVYAITVLRTVRSDSVPRISITVGFVLTVAGAVLLVLFLGHVVTELRVETMLRHVHREQERVQEQIVGGDDETDDETDDDSGAERDDGPGSVDLAGEPPRTTVTADESGYVTAVDEAELLETAGGAGVAIRLLRPVGAAVTVGAPIAEYRQLARDGHDGHDGGGDGRDDVCAGVRRSVVLGFERTGAQDLGYGIQQLVDVYVKALSPGINDPTTAVTSLGHVGGVFARLAHRPLQPRALRDDDGRVRVIVPLPTFGELLEQALGPLRTYGSSDPRVLIRAMEVLRDVGWVAPDGPRRDAVREQIELLLRAADDGLPQERDRARIRAAADRACAACDGRWQ
jgi:uncharacterized membrane protein